MSSLEYNVDQLCGGRRRSVKFSQNETDLLCRLIGASTKEGQEKWNEITDKFNAAPFSVSRSNKVLRERAHNIRKCFNKLTNFVSKRSSNPHHLKHPPRVSFRLTEAVKEYAESVGHSQICLMLATSDCDEPPESDVSAQSSFRLPVLDYAESNNAEAQIQNDEFASSPESTSAPNDRLSPFAFEFKTEPSTPPPPTVNRNNVHDRYNEFKIAALQDEIARRKEWHAISMDINRQELALKRKQTEFWDAAICNLQKQTKINHADPAADSMMQIIADVSPVRKQTISMVDDFDE